MMTNKQFIVFRNKYTIKITGYNLHLCYAFALCYEYCLKCTLESLIAELQNTRRIPDIIMTSVDMRTIVKNLLDGIGEKINDCLKWMDENKPAIVIAIAAIIFIIVVSLPADIAVAAGATVTSLFGVFAQLVPKIPAFG